jgi:hypothetical protein
MTTLDFAYTKVFENAKPRTKFQMFRGMKNTRIDYAFLGSSRVDNDIVPSVITNKTKKSVINLGFQGGKLYDVYTILRLFKIYNIQVKTIFIQVDYNFNIDGHSNMLAYQIIPFIHENAITRAHCSNFPNFKAMYYVPFYRYCVNDCKIGFREICMSLIEKKTTTVSNLGYSPVTGSTVGTNYELPSFIRKNNPTFSAIDNYCKKNGIDVVYFCAPFWKQSKNLNYISKLKVKIPSLKDYSGVVTIDSLFLNNAHLNDAGAAYFSKYLAQELLVK